MHYNRMKLTVGIFVLVLFVTIFTMLYLALDENGTFNKRYNYHFTTSSATFFSVGMPLKLSGFDIGVIDKISLKADASVYVTFSVDEVNRKWITNGTSLMIIKPFIGSAYIEVHSAINNKVLEADAHLPMVQSNDINDLILKIEPIIDNIIHIINNIDDITSYLARDDSDILITLQNLKKFSTTLAKNKSLLTTFTGDDKSTKSVISSLNNIKKVVSDLNKITQDIGGVVSHLDPQIIKPTSSAMKELDVIMKDIKKKLDVLDSTVNVIGNYDNDLVELKNGVSTTLKKSNEIVDKIDSLMQDEEKEEIELP